MILKLLFLFSLFAYNVESINLEEGFNNVESANAQEKLNLNLQKENYKEIILEGIQEMESIARKNLKFFNSPSQRKINFILGITSLTLIEFVRSKFFSSCNVYAYYFFHAAANALLYYYVSNVLPLNFLHTSSYFENFSLLKTVSNC